MAVFVNDGDKTREEVLGGFDGWCARVDVLCLCL